MTTTFLGLPTAPRGVGHLRGDKPFPDAAREALRDGQLRANLGHATSTIRAKRAAVVENATLAWDTAFYAMAIEGS